MASLRGQREVGDDFFCFKYQIWYRLDDCAFRHHFRTFAGCVDCSQGAFNLGRLESPPRRPRWTELPRAASGS